MKTIFRYLRPLAGLVIASVAFLFIQAMTELKLPDLMSELVDTGIIALDGKENQMRFILTEGAKMLGVALISVGAAVTVNYLSTKTAAQFSKRMRHDVFTRVSSFSSAEFNKFSTASLITRTTNDIQQLQNVLAMGVRMICFAPVMGIGSIVMAVRKSPSMSWILGLAVAVLLTMITVIFKISMPKFRIQQKLIDRLNLVSRENLSGMMVIRAFGNEKHEEERFKVANNNLRKTNRFVQRTVTIMFPFMTILMNATSLMVVWFGAKAIAQSNLEIGDMMAYIQYAMHVIMSFMFVALLFIGVPRALVSANRVGEILDTDI